MVIWFEANGNVSSNHLIYRRSGAWMDHSYTGFVMKRSLKYLMFSLLIPFIIMGCRRNANEREIELDCLNATMKIPGSYKRLTSQNFSGVISSKADVKFRVGILTYMDQNPDDLIYMDTVDPYYFMMISAIEYVPIDSMTLYAAIDWENNRTDIISGYDSNYYYGSKYGHFSDVRYIVSKRWRKSFITKRVCFTYIFTISTADKTAGISFFSPVEQNVMKYIWSIRKK
jgi:hypothetical protein